MTSTLEFWFHLQLDDLCSISSAFPCFHIPTEIREYHDIVFESGYPLH